MKYVTKVTLLTPLEPQSRFWGQTNQIPRTLSPKRDCGPKRVKGCSSRDYRCESYSARHIFLSFSR